MHLVNQSDTILGQNYRPFSEVQRERKFVDERLFLRHSRSKVLTGVAPGGTPSASDPRVRLDRAWVIEIDGCSYSAS